MWGKLLNFEETTFFSGALARFGRSRSLFHLQCSAMFRGRCRPIYAPWAPRWWGGGEGRPTNFAGGNYEREIIKIRGKPFFFSGALARFGRSRSLFHLQCSAADAALSTPHGAKWGGGGGDPTNYQMSPTNLGLYDYSLKWALRRVRNKVLESPPPVTSLACATFRGWRRTDKVSTPPPPPPHGLVRIDAHATPLFQSSVF